MSDPTPNPLDQQQESAPPDVALVARAAQRLPLILDDPDRSTADKRRAIDALGRALLRLKRSL